MGSSVPPGVFLKRALRPRRKEEKEVKKYCDGCGVTHTTVMCFNKPRRPIKKESDKTYSRRKEVSREWFVLNPPDGKGIWICYLQIAPNCPVKLTRSTIRLEHVLSKVRHPELKYDVGNLKPACDNCNKLKGSLSETEAREKFKTRHNQ